MTRVISIVSGKGGVGKTMLAANLGIALSELGKSVTLIDGNITTANLSLHLGMPIFPVTLHDVLKGKSSILDAIYEHHTGVKIIPAGISLEDLKGTDIRDLPSLLTNLFGKEEIIIIDAAAGLGREALTAMESGDEVIFVTNPELPAVLDVLKAGKLSLQLGVKPLGCVVNRVTGKKHEMNEREISSLTDMEILAKIPEDENVKKAISEKLPVIKYKPNSPASVEIKKLARRLIGIDYFEEPWYKKVLWFLR